MAATDDLGQSPHINAQFPLGTVFLEEKRGTTDHIVLHPIPTDDPNDPLNWSKWRKGVNFGLTCTFVTFTFVVLCNTYVAFAPYEEDLGVTYQDFNDAIASNYAGLAIGSIFFIPFVHRLGRRPLYLISTAIQFAVSIWAAQFRSRRELIPNSLIAGLGGAVSETIVVITISDLFFVHNHAIMNGIFLLMQSIGAFLGPVIMGYAVDNLGWRWMWWITTILVGVNFVAVLFFFEESKYIVHNQGHSSTSEKPEELAGSAQHDLNKDGKPLTDDPVRIQTTTEAYYPMKSYRQRLAFVTPTKEPVLKHFYQPFLIFFTIPAVAYAAITYGSILAWVAVMTSTQSSFTLEPPYNLSPSGIGLLNLAPFIGLAIGSFIFPPLSDWSIVWLSKRNNGIFEPEMRLWLAIPGAALCLTGVLTFGMCLADLRPLISLEVGYAIYCVGFVICGDVALTYMLDIYHDILGDAMIAVVFLRNAISVIIMFEYAPWVEHLGVRNTFFIVAFVGLFLLTIPILLLIWGKKLRIQSEKRYNYFARLQHIHRAA